MKKTINIVMRNLATGGAEKVLITFLKNFDRSKYVIHLILHTEEGELLEELPSDINIHSLVPKDKNVRNKIKRALFKRILFYAPLCLRKYWENKYPADITVSFMEGIATHVAGYMPGKKIAWVHTNVIENPWADESFRSLEQQKRIYRKFGKLIFVSSSGMENFNFKFKNVNVKKEVIHNVIDTKEIDCKITEVNKEFCKWSKQTDNTVRIISVGRADEVKRFDLLIQSFNTMKRLTKDNISLTIIGDGAEFENLKKLKKKLNLSNLYLLGAKKNPLPFVKCADLFVNTSRVESYPTAIAESLVVGTPVLASKNGGAEEILSDEKFGALMDKNANSTEVAGKILDMIQHLNFWKSRANEAKNHFSTNEVLSKYDELFSTLE